MFSLIITIISIALVAALALATLYYGGVAFQRGAASADATKLYTQAQQLQGAAELYKADTGAYPLTLASLLSANYLKSIPVSRLVPPAAPNLLSQAMAASEPWDMVLSGSPVFAVGSVTVPVCEAVNLKSYGISGILKSARSSYAIQCYGPDANNLTVVTSKSGDALIAASLSALATVPLGTVLTSAPPAVDSGDVSAAGWLTVESATVAGGGAPAGPTSASYTVTGSTDFGTLAAFESSTLTLTLTNTGTAPVRIGDVVVPGGLPNSFVVQSTDCPASSTVVAFGGSLIPLAFAGGGAQAAPDSLLAASDAATADGAPWANPGPWAIPVGGSCHVELSVANAAETLVAPPLSIGSQTGTVTVVSPNAGDQVRALSAEFPPFISMDTDMYLGSVVAAPFGGYETTYFVLTNWGNVPLTGITVTSDNALFTSTDNCVGTIDSLYSCQVTVTYHATSSNTETGIFTLTSAEGATATATLYGTVAP